MYRDSHNTSLWRIALTLAAVVASVVALLLLPVACQEGPARRDGGRPAEESTRTTTPTPEATRPAEPTPSVPPTGQGGETPPPDERSQVPAGSVVVIDAGHQGKSNPNPEKVGPGSSQTKPGTTSGTQGVATGKPESVLTLEIALKVRDELASRGVKVVMVRTSQNVNLTNQQRAAIANREDADLFLRIHADGSTDPQLRGVSTLVPAPNQWTRPIVAESTRAGRIIQRALVRETGAVDLGVVPRTDITGFNWSEVPTTLIEVGFMSNPVEDRMLSTSAYQAKLSEGMADGVVAYLNAAK